MDLKSIMEKYGEQLGLPDGIPANTEGVYELPFSDEFSIQVRNNNPGIEFRASLGEFPLDKEDKFLPHMMMANLFGTGTRGATLGLAVDGKTIILLQDWPDDLSYQAFQEGLEDFFNVAESWYNEAKGRIKG